VVGQEPTYLAPVATDASEYVVPGSQLDDTEYLHPIATMPTYYVTPANMHDSAPAVMRASKPSHEATNGAYYSTPSAEADIDVAPTYTIFNAAIPDQPEYQVPQRAPVLPSRLNLNEAVAIARNAARHDGELQGQHGAISRDDAEDRLAEQPVGTYLLRELATTGEGTVLSVRRNRGCRHYRITFDTTKLQWHLSGGHDLGSREQLATVNDAVAHVKLNSSSLIGMTLGPALVCDLSEL
jgi:hypothetical protein